MKHFHYFLVFPLFALGSLVLSGGQNGHVQGQQGKSKTTVYPTVLYPGENVLTFSNPDGIQEIKPMFDSLTTSLMDIEVLDPVADCPDSLRLRLKVNTVSQGLTVRFMVTDCNKKRRVFVLKNFKCILEEFTFPDVEVGDTVCQKFEIGLSDNEFGVRQYVLDSIVPSVPNAIVQVDSWPITINVGTIYSYTVCFVAREVGEHKFGVSVWQSIVHPTGKTQVLPITDTGVVRVVPKEYDSSPSPGGMRDR